MIFLFFAFIYVLIISYIYGWVVIKGINKLLNSVKPSSTKIILLGLTVITTIACLFSLFFRINWGFQVVLLVGAIIAFFITKPYKNLDISSFRLTSISKWLILSLSVVVSLVILNATTLSPANSDTGIYHAQTIRWIEQYPAVPGLANLHARLGYNSSWLLLNSIFSFSFLGLHSFHFMTGFLFLVASLYFVSGIKNIIAKEIKLSDILKTLFLFSIFIFLLDQASSPGTDSPATIFEWILITETVRLLEQKERRNSSDFYLIAILAVFCFTIKISAFPILLLSLPAILSVFRREQSRISWILIGILGLMVLPFLIRNVILTGYLFFPGPAVDLFKLDWRVPINILSAESKTIHWFAAIPHMDQAEFYAMPAGKWLPIWFDNQLPRHKAIMAAVLSIPIILLCLLVVKKTRSYFVTNKVIFLPLLTAYLGIIFWFLAAPTFRFGYGFLLSAVLLGVSLMIGALITEANWALTCFKYSILPVLLIGIVLTSRSTLNIATLNDRILLPIDYPEWSTEPCVFGNFTILCQASYDSCWYSAFPCAIKGELNIEMRGTDFRQGFRNLDNN